MTYLLNIDTWRLKYRQQKIFMRAGISGLTYWKHFISGTKCLDTKLWMEHPHFIVRSIGANIRFVQHEGVPRCTALHRNASRHVESRRVVRTRRTNLRGRQRTKRTHELRGMRMAWSSPFKTKRSPRREPTSLTCLTRLALLYVSFSVYSFFRRKAADKCEAFPS